MRRERFRSYPPRAFGGGLLLLLLSAYLCLVTGFLEQTSGRLLGEILSNDSVTITVSGLRSDLFWRTSAREVTVTGPRGLGIRVLEPRASGALHEFASARRLESLHVAVLEIDLPGPGADTSAATIPEILEDIDRGIVAGADSLRLDTGWIRDGEGLLLDGMSISTSVSRGRGVVLNVANAAAWIRGVGWVSGNGQLEMEDGVVSSSGFSGETPFGNLYLAGRLSGGDGAVDLMVSGSASTAGLELPVEASMDFEGFVAGTLPDPLVSTRLYNGEASVLGNPLSFSADTLLVSRAAISFRGLSMDGPGLSILSDLSWRPADGSWEVEALAMLNGLDPSRLDAGLPSGLLNGSAWVSAEGTGDAPAGISTVVDLQNSTLAGRSITSASADGAITPGGWRLSADIAAPGVSALLVATGSTSAGLVPSSWSGRLSFSVEDASFVPGLELPESLAVRRSSGDLAFSGNRAALTASGTVGVEQVVLPGAVRVDGLSLDGEVSLSGRDPAGSVLFTADTLMTPVASFRAAGSASFSDGVYTSDGIDLVTADGFEVHLEGAFDSSTPAYLSLENVTAGSAKQRLVLDSGLLCLIDSAGVGIDTAWVVTPHGDLGISGSIGGERTCFRITGRRFDLAPVGGLLHLARGLSGSAGFVLSAEMREGVLHGALTGTVVGPSFGAYQADSITFDLALEDDDLAIRRVSSWEEGQASTLTAWVDDFATLSGVSPGGGSLREAELILNDLGDWVFYALPIPLRTRGADISAHLEYRRDAPPDRRFTAEAVASIDRLFITALNMYLSNVVMHITPDSTGYHTRISVSSADSTRGTILSTILLDFIQDSLSVTGIGAYSFRADFDSFRASVGGFANLMLSGYVKSEGTDPVNIRPEVLGKLEIVGGVIGMPQGGQDSGEPQPLPVDVRISIRGSRGLWFRNSLADIEMGVDLTILTQEGLPTITGTLASVRGKVHILQKDFEIVHGLIEFLPGVPSQQTISITAETEIRGAVDRNLYHIVVSIQGTPRSPVILLSGDGPGGSLSQEDILSLLAVGITYGELQQLDSGALQAQLGGAAQSYIGQLLARSLRDGVGLDQLELSPELLSDSTSLRLDIGKYVLPDLFLSFSGDVFSSEPGTISAQYYIRQDLYLEGSTKSTLHGDQEPSLELHYTLRY